MKPQTLLLAALAGLASSASIHRRSFSSSPWPGAVRDFFAAVGDELREWKQNGDRNEPGCDFSRNARMPTAGLPPPSTGLVLYHVAVGRGTQVSIVPFLPFFFFFPHHIRKAGGLRQDVNNRTIHAAQTLPNHRSKQAQQQLSSMLPVSQPPAPNSSPL